MAGAAPRIEGDSSNFARPQRVIECSPTVLQQIRGVVLDRFNRAPHGGDEVCGVLFGSHHEREVRITAFRPLPDGADGNGDGGATPGQEAYASLLAAYSDPMAGIPGNGGGTATLEAVGCFRAHPRSTLVLSKQDLEIYNSLFAESWQVAMIVRPGNLAASRIRIFFRDEDGTLRAEGGFRELMQSAFDETPSDVDLESGGSAPEAAPTGQDADQFSEPVPEEAADAASVPAFDQVPSFGFATDVEGEIGDHGALVADEPAPAARPRKRIGVGTIIWPSFVIAAVLVSVVLFWMSRSQQLALRVMDDGGQLRISWDQHARAVEGGESGRLEIADGNNKLWLELDRDQLRKANVTYPPRSNSVTVRLVVQQHGAQPVEEMARFVGVQSTNHRWQPAERPPESAPEKPAEVVVAVPVEAVADASVTAPSPVSTPAKAAGKQGGAEGNAPPALEAHNRAAASLAVAQRPETSLAEKPVRPAASGPITSSTSSIEGTAGPHNPAAQNGASHVTSTPVTSSGAQGSAAGAVHAPVSSSTAPSSLPTTQTIAQNTASPLAAAGTQIPAARAPAPNAGAAQSVGQTAAASAPQTVAPSGAQTSAAPGAQTAAAPAAQTVASRAAALPRGAGAASGRIIWIGRLQKNELLTITGKSASNGSVMGELPGRPVKVSVSPGDLSNDGVVLYTSNLQYANSVVEPPSAENGWNKTVYTWSPRLANDISMQEAPGAQNEWKRVVLKSKNPKISVIVIEWAVVN